MDNDLNKNDALGNPIVMGNTYGYSLDNDGYTKVSIGVAKKFTPTSKVSLVVHTIRDTEYHYGTTLQEGLNKKVAVKPIKLFPVYLPKKEEDILFE